LLRYRFAAAAAMMLSTTAMLRAQEELPPGDAPVASLDLDTSPADMAAMPDSEWNGDLQEAPMSGPGEYPNGMTPDQAEHGWSSFWPRPQWFGLRHSSTHGRNVGRGQPLTGTSWRNRPYYVGGQIGPMWFTQSLDENVSTDIDTFGGIFAGWDSDHYWGNELHLDWSTPELRNSQVPDAERTDSSFTWNYSCLYYPWGDAKVRPYWRAGIGNTHFDWPLNDGTRDDEWMWTFPLGVGMKYPIRRWLAARAEITDYLSLDDDLPTQHNVALTFGLEWRFGAHPPSYWPWNPSRHIW
jgi:hypothetical protein